MHTHHKEIAILYHGGCPDGLGGAYAAWKKFGDTADYIPVKHGLPVPEHIAGKKLYFVDFCYPKEIMDKLASEATSLTVLDHHLGVKDIVESMPEHVFDANHSGAVIAWHYFHPDASLPAMLKYIEDGDLYKFALPHSREILAYMYTSPLLSSPFEHWDALIQKLDDSEELERIVQAGAVFQQYQEHVVENAVNHAELVRFEGFECYLAGTSGEFVSDTGNRLAIKRPPLALILSASAAGLRVSLRSDGSVNVATIAQKYGGNGHPAASGFMIPFGKDVPWEIVKKDEHSRD